MIVTNFMWAMFNSDDPISFITPDVAYKMPDAEKGKKRSLYMPVWCIDNDISLHYEGVEL